MGRIWHSLLFSLCQNTHSHWFWPEKHKIFTVVKKILVSIFETLKKLTACRLSSSFRLISASFSELQSVRLSAWRSALWASDQRYLDRSNLADCTIKWISHPWCWVKCTLSKWSPIFGANMSVWPCVSTTSALDNWVMKCCSPTPSPNRPGKVIDE